MAADRGHMPQASAEGVAERGCSNFLLHEIYKNSVSFLESEMGIEGQIMCIDKCTF